MGTTKFRILTAVIKNSTKNVTHFSLLNKEYCYALLHVQKVKNNIIVFFLIASSLNQEDATRYKEVIKISVT